MKLTPEEHRARHVELQKALDELVADFMLHTGARPSTATVLDLMTWAFQQTTAPTEEDPSS